MDHLLSKERKIDDRFCLVLSVLEREYLKKEEH